MPDFSAGNHTSATVDLDAVSAITGDVFPRQIDQPSAPVADRNPQGSHDVAVTEPVTRDPNYAAGVYVEPGHDPASKAVRERYPGGQPVAPDTPGGDAVRGREPFSEDNAAAVPTFQRSSHDFTSGVLVLSDSQQVVGRMRGRESTTIWCPPTDQLGNAVNGFIFGETEGELQQGTAAAYVLPGMSVTIRSEAPVWAAPIPGGSSPATVCYKTEYNPAGGALGGL